MKKLLRLFLLMLASSMLMITQLNAQTILCVDRDFSDTAIGFSDTWGPISRALDAGGYSYDYWEVLPDDEDGPPYETMINYDIIIWFSGESWQEKMTMSDNDETNLGDYLFGGGKLFLNAQDYLYDRYNGFTSFDPGDFPSYALGVEEVEQDVYHIEVGEGIGDSARFYGLPGSLAEGLEFPTVDIFTTVSDDGLYGDSIGVHAGISMFGILVPYVSVGPAAIQYESALGFRTVFSTIDVAAISDTVARDIYMDRVVYWLMYGIIGTEELNAENAGLLIRPNPVTSTVNIGMNLPMEEVSIFSNQGQLVRHEIVKGSAVKIDMEDLAPGIYVLKAKTNKGIVSSKLIKQ
ncbi:MAG: hypothetical protein DRI97_01975 [Bacteroidetes bacterium]|nr:MAG: hypothetical protein DRI83_04445 [Bacteroidota bacterium]RLD59021.1 MAG: hypothetical protein DRI97_01975 [Bacteroidota bacterium]RLD81566.1 MAG: hypothetical protein DRJ15_04065 [Bacteroidota bacterium]